MLSITANVKSFFNHKFQTWLKKRMPAAKKQQLSNKNIFIVPSKFGFAYLFTCVVLFLFGTNYQNNLILLLCFLMLSVFLSTMIFSFLNLAGLTIEFKSMQNTFAESPHSIHLCFSSNKEHFNLTCAFAGHPSYLVEQFKQSQQISLPLLFSSRGKKQLSRLKITSQFPLGLFTCWTHIDLAAELIVYPKPIFSDFNLDNVANNAENDKAAKPVKKTQQNVEDFEQLRNYQQGEPFSKVSWKHLAKKQGWYSKDYQSNETAGIWLNLQSVNGAQLETKLSQLTGAVLSLTAEQKNFALKLANEEIPLGNDVTHQLACLTLLACYHHD